VPSSAVIQDALNTVVPGADHDAAHFFSQVRRDPEWGGLVAADKNEDVWAWNNGEKWGDNLLTDENDD